MPRALVRHADLPHVIQRRSTYGIAVQENREAVMDRKPSVGRQESVWQERNALGKADVEQAVKRVVLQEHAQDDGGLDGNDNKDESPTGRFTGAPRPCP